MAIDRIRTGAREDLTDDLEDQPAAADATRTIEDALVLREAMKALPEHCTEILDRFFARDESYRTIAAAMDIPPGTIASRISRCLSRLRTQIGEFSG